MDWLTNFFQELSWPAVAWGAAVFVITFVASLVVVGILVVLLPATFFLESHDRRFWVHRHPILRWTGTILKNLLGLALIVLGVGLSLPGIPGQGLLTILIGLILMDFPGKRKLERKIVGRPKVLAAINRLRARFKKPRLLLDENDSPQYRQAKADQSRRSGTPTTSPNSTPLNTSSPGTIPPTAATPEQNDEQHSRPGDGSHHGSAAEPPTERSSDGKAQSRRE